MNNPATTVSDDALSSPMNQSLRSLNESSSSDSSAYDPHDYRSDFPILSRRIGGDRPLVYLDNAASTQRPNVVIDAMADCYKHYYANVHRGIHTLSEESTEAYESARRSVAAFINAASSREVIFTAGTTAAINTVAKTWGASQIGPDDCIVLPITEHHANIVPWHQLRDQTGCRLEFLPIDDDFLIDDSVLVDALRNHQPKLLTFGAASNVTGVEYPVKRWTRIAHEHGAHVLVDAAQAAPHMPIDVRQWDVDFLVFSGHKVCGPTGIGVLYGRETLLESMPPFLGGGGMIQRVTTDGFECAALPDKFEAGTPPIAEAIGLAAAVDYLQDIGLERIHRHEQRLAARADAALREIDGVRIIGPTPDHKGGIVSFHMARPHSHDVSHTLAAEGIAVRAGHHCTMPLHQSLGIAASTRASFYLYNTDDEVDRLIDAVTQIGRKFAPTGRRRRAKR